MTVICLLVFVLLVILIVAVGLYSSDMDDFEVKYSKYDVKIVFMVLIYMVECGLCWVTYFALYYVKMKKRYTTLEMMKLYAAMFSITVPGINILLCAWWYVRGARRWNEYVRDL